MFNLNNYMHLAPENHGNTFSKQLELDQYSRGMGAMGLPGDLSSQSRFVRVAFVKMNSLSGDSEAESVSQFFHILGSVDQQRGCCRLGTDKYEITLYTSCCNTDRGIYYYNTYDNHRITGVDMHKENLDGKKSDLLYARDRRTDIYAELSRKPDCHADVSFFSVPSSRRAGAIIDDRIPGNRKIPGDSQPQTMRSGIGRSLRPIVFGCVLREGVRLRVAAIAGRSSSGAETGGRLRPASRALPPSLASSRDAVRVLQGYRIPLIAAGARNRCDCAD